MWAPASKWITACFMGLMVVAGVWLGVVISRQFGLDAQLDWFDAWLAGAISFHAGRTWDKN